MRLLLLILSQSFQFSLISLDNGCNLSVDLRAHELWIHSISTPDYGDCRVLEDLPRRPVLDLEGYPFWLSHSFELRMLKTNIILDSLMILALVLFNL